MRQRSESRTSEKASPRFRVLLVGHDPTQSAEATIVLAAVAARNGLLGDGRPSCGRNADGATPPAAGAATVAEVARETGLHRGAVGRGVAELLRSGQLLQSERGLQAAPDALTKRWADHRRRIRLDERLRSLGLRADPLLLAAMVAGQVDESGRWVCGMPRLIERTGIPRRCLFRHLAAAERAQAIHRWIAPIGRGQMILAPGGVSRSGTRELSQTGTRKDAEEIPSAADREPAQERCREAAPVDVANRHLDCREPALKVSRSGTRHPDLRSTGSPPEADAPAAPAGDPVAARPVQQQQQAPAAPAVLGAGDPAAIVERFVTVLARRGVDKLEPRHAADVAGLLDALGPPTAARDRAALARERLRLCTRVVAWCPSPERLGRWLLRVRARFGVQNLGAYLRRASERGDAGTVLDSQNRVGRAAETWQDFSSATERVLEGRHAVAVQQLVAGGAAVLVAPGDERDRLRAELRRCLAENLRAAARAVLLKLVGPKHDDMALARAIGDVCAVSDARALLQEVA